MPTYTVGASVHVPLFNAGADKARSIEAAATARRRRAELEDTRAKVYYEVQTQRSSTSMRHSDRWIWRRAPSRLPMSSWRRRATVSSAGSPTPIEVVQAQEALASSPRCERRQPVWIQRGAGRPWRRHSAWLKKTCRDSSEQRSNVRHHPHLLFLRRPVRG